MGLLVMILGLVLFFAAHTFTTKREARAEAIARLGERTYKILYSLVSVAALVLIVRGFGHYREAGIWNVWEPPTFLKYITVVLMLPAFILFVASYIRGHIFATVKHPMLASTKLWAAGHLLANGDLGSIILFGSFLGWAGYDRFSLKHRTDSGGPPIPVGGVTNDLIAITVGVAAYLALAFYVHPVVIRGNEGLS